MRCRRGAAHIFMLRWYLGPAAVLPQGSCRLGAGAIIGKGAFATYAALLFHFIPLVE